VIVVNEDAFSGMKNIINERTTLIGILGSGVEVEAKSVRVGNRTYRSYSCISFCPK
jgi:hypothetical protein